MHRNANSGTGQAAHRRGLRAVVGSELRRLATLSRSVPGVWRLRRGSQASSAALTEAPPAPVSGSLPGDGGRSAGQPALRPAAEVGEFEVGEFEVGEFEVGEFEVGELAVGDSPPAPPRCISAPPRYISAPVAPAPPRVTPSPYARALVERSSRGAVGQAVPRVVVAPELDGRPAGLTTFATSPIRASDLASPRTFRFARWAAWGLVRSAAFEDAGNAGSLTIRVRQINGTPTRRRWYR